MKRLILSASILIFLSSCSSDNISANAVPSENGDCSKALYQIKGNRNDKGEWIYHMPGQQYYKKTNAEECFSNEYDAQQAGYRKSKR